VTDSTPGSGTHERRPEPALNWLTRGAALAVLGLVAWALMWSTIRPRAGYDTLWYSMYAYQYAGVSVHDSWDLSWQLVHEYADPRLLAILRRTPSGDWWGGWDQPARQRWIGIYRMRPVMPIVSAIGFPLLGREAPLLASAAAVMVVAVGAGLVLAPLTGWLAAALFLLLTLANALLSRWLIDLTTDGLGIALWFLALGCAARYVAAGDRRWLVGTCGVALLLTFTRQSAVILPVSLTICAVVALVAGAATWRRFAVGAIATTLPLLVFTAYTAIAGLPSFADLLQDVPTMHFSKPDVPNPIQFLLVRGAAIAPALIRSLPHQPIVWGSLLGAAGGFVVARQWWLAPFVVAIGTVPLLLAAHPILTEADRTLAPIWLSLNLGIALLAARAMGWLSSRLSAGTVESRTRS